jgi:hypothetical protein
MIIIKAINNGEFIEPERTLTIEEKATVTSAICNGIEYIYYQGDEPLQVE